MINSTNEIFTFLTIIRSKVLKGKRKGDKWKTNSFNARLIVRSLGQLNSLLFYISLLFRKSFQIYQFSKFSLTTTTHTFVLLHSVYSITFYIDLTVVVGSNQIHTLKLKLSYPNTIQQQRTKSSAGKYLLFYA